MAEGDGGESNHWLFILNPAAGGGRARAAWRRLYPWLEAADSLTYDLIRTKAPGDATDKAGRLTEERCDAVIAVGGDGTVQEVAAGLAHGPLPLGIIPAGTGNDFSRSLGIPRHPVRAARALLEGTTTVIDLHRVNGHIFANVAGLGFDAQVAQRTNEGKKRLGGPLPYLGAILRTLRQYRNIPVRLRVDDEEMELPVVLVAVGSGRYYGGGFHILPDADNRDGRLDVCVAGDLSKPALVQMIPKMFWAGHRHHPLVHFFRGRRVEVEPVTAKRPLWLHADGEVLGSGPASFTVLPDALEVLVPA